MTTETEEREPWPLDALLTCSKCKQQKAVRDFYWWRARNRPHYYCKQCMKSNMKSWVSKNRDKHNEIVLRWYHRNREQAAQKWQRWYSTKSDEERRDMWLRVDYAITLGEYNRLKAEQGGLCAICRQPERDKPLGVDHDHATGHIRGLLCRPCNLWLGKWKDDPDICPDTPKGRGAARYLTERGYKKTATK